MPDEIVCRRCGHVNANGGNFCSSCGAPLTDLTEAPTETLLVEEIQAAGPGTVVGFVVSRGPKAGSRYRLDPGVSSLGRHPESTIFFDDITVSRRHAEVDFDGDVVTVRDVGSLNGSYVNNQSLDQPRQLADGDVLQIGKFKLLFFTEDD